MGTEYSERYVQQSKCSNVSTTTLAHPPPSTELRSVGRSRDGGGKKTDTFRFEAQVNKKAGIRAHRGPIGRTNKRFGVKLRGARNILVFGPKRRPVRRIRGSTRPIVAPGRPGVLLSMYSVITRIVYAQLTPIPK